MRSRSAVLTGFLHNCFLLSLTAGLFLHTGCGGKSDKPAEKGDPDYLVTQGDLVKVEYKGTLEDGTVFDESQKGAPLEFTVGSGQVIPGFDQGLIGMKLNEVKTVTIPPEDAYGMPQPDMIRDFHRSFFPEDLELETGLVLQLQDQSGRTHQAIVAEIKGDSVGLDLNHPLAGKTLVFEIKVTDIK